ncbi:MAG TPA: hypothetical protein PLU22_19130 [Polyangiaceae bacterium]|nr:hypothetical protein [Polyangiaceae bacterium]
MTFGGVPWSRDISHRELIRAGVDQTLEIDGTNLGYLGQGFDPGANTADHNAIPWRLGLLTPRRAGAPTRRAPRCPRQRRTGVATRTGRCLTAPDGRGSP